MNSGHCLVCYQFLTPENIHGLDDSYIPTLCSFLNLPPTEDFVEVLSVSFYCLDCLKGLQRGCQIQENFEKCKLELEKLQKRVYGGFARGFNASLTLPNTTTTTSDKEGQSEGQPDLGLEGLYMQRFLIVQQLDLALEDIDENEDNNDEIISNFDGDFDGGDEIFNYDDDSEQQDNDDYNEKKIDDQTIFVQKEKKKFNLKVKQGASKSNLRKGIKIKKRPGPKSHSSKTNRIIREKIRSKSGLKLGLELTICQICGLSFRNNYIKIHMAKHDESLKPFMCSTCGMKFAKNNRLRKHEKESKCAPEYLRPPNWKCKPCDLHFTIKSDLKEHIDEFHPDEELDIKCSICSEIFSRPTALEMHIKSKHVKDLGLELKEIQCDACDYKCTLQKFMAVHKARHHSGGRGRKYKCTIEECSKAYFTSFALKRHIKSHTGGKDFNCHICGNSYVENRNLQRHIKIKHPTSTD